MQQDELLVLSDEIDRVQAEIPACPLDLASKLRLNAHLNELNDLLLTGALSCQLLMQFYAVRDLILQRNYDKLHVVVQTLSTQPAENQPLNIAVLSNPDSRAYSGSFSVSADSCDDRFGDFKRMREFASQKNDVHLPASHNSVFNAITPKIPPPEPTAPVPRMSTARPSFSQQSRVARLCSDVHGEQLVFDRKIDGPIIYRAFPCLAEVQARLSHDIQALEGRNAQLKRQAVQQTDTVVRSVKMCVAQPRKPVHNAVVQEKSKTAAERPQSRALRQAKAQAAVQSVSVGVSVRKQEHANVQPSIAATKRSRIPAVHSPKAAPLEPDAQCVEVVVVRPQAVKTSASLRSPSAALHSSAVKRLRDQATQHTHTDKVAETSGFAAATQTTEAQHTAVQTEGSVARRQAVRGKRGQALGSFVRQLAEKYEIRPNNLGIEWICAQFGGREVRSFAELVNAV